MDFPARIDKLRSLATQDSSAYTRAVLELSAEIDAEEAHAYMVRTAPSVMYLTPSPGAQVRVGDAIYPDMTLHVQSPSDPPGPSPLRRALNTVLGLDPKTSRAELLLGPMSRGALSLPGLRAIDAHGRAEDGWAFVSAYTEVISTADERRRGIASPSLGVDPADHLRSSRWTFLSESLNYPRFLRGVSASDVVFDEVQHLDPARRTKTAEQAVAASIARAKQKSDRRRAAGAAWSMRWQRDVHAASDLLQRASATGDEDAYQTALRRASVRINVARDAALSANGVSWVSRALDNLLAQVRSQFGQSVHFAHLHWPAALLALCPPVESSLMAQLLSQNPQPLRGDQPVGDDDGTPHP